MNDSQSIADKIKYLAKKRNAIILAHNYQLGEVQDIADFTGDSLELSRIAAQTDKDVIVFCGVYFMAETAKVLSPSKTVLMPDPTAGCPMADMINVEQMREFKKFHPGVPVVAYVNTSAEVKAEADICCTSANAARVLEYIESDVILFVPDKSLGAWAASQTKKKIITYPGYCPTHHRILAQDVINMKALKPNAEVVAHPECLPEVVKLADAVRSTSGMLRYAAESSAREFIVCTERGLLHALQKRNPDKKFYNPSPLNICPNMKKIALEKILRCLEDMEHEIILSDEVIEKARKAIEGMLSI